MKEYIRQFDRSAAAQVALLPDRSQTVMLWATYLGYPAVMAALAAVIALAGWYLGYGPVALAALLIIASMAIPIGIKMLTRRARPDTIYVQNMRFKSYSFPSGHSFSSLAVLGLVSLISSNPLLQAALVVVIVLIGISRIYLGAHFPSDVVAGWLLGFGSLMIIARIAHV